MEPKSPRALDLPPIVIAVLTLLLTATAAVGECPSADELMESQVNLTTSKLHKSSTIYLDRLYMHKLSNLWQSQSPQAGEATTCQNTRALVNPWKFHPKWFRQMRVHSGDPTGNAPLTVNCRLDNVFLGKHIN